MRRSWSERDTAHRRGSTRSHRWVGTCSLWSVCREPARCPPSPPPPNRIRFSGYEWRVREFRSNRAGTNEYHIDNVRVADDGALHLSVVERGETWTSAEVALTRTLGYGTYAFVVRDLSQLDPAAMLTMFTYDDKGPGETFREMNIQVKRPSEAGPVEGQSIVQPNYLAGNISRYAVPSGTVTHWFRWEPGRVVFARESRRSTGIAGAARDARIHDRRADDRSGARDPQLLLRAQVGDAAQTQCGSGR